MNMSVRKIAVTAVLAALNIVFSSFGIPLGFSTLYLTDVAVCAAGILLDPFCAVIAGGFGAFLGDLFFYPAAMIVTLIIRSIQALVISSFTRLFIKGESRFIASVVGCAIGIVIMATGYSFFAILFYSKAEVAFIKLPLEALQATVGAILALLLCYKFRLKKYYDKILYRT